MEKMTNGIGVSGHLVVKRSDGSIMFEGKNMIVNAGLEALVDALVSAGNINTFKYVGFGTGNSNTTAADAALGAEVAGGTYARVAATQAEGDNARQYRLTGTWTNTSGASRAVTEYGVFSASTVGIMLCRICDNEDAQELAKTVGVNDTISFTWNINLTDVA